MPPPAAGDHHHSPLQPVHNTDIDLCDNWCVVEYDGSPYPGVIIDSDDDSIEVKSMHRIGHNRFYWPDREDTIWYEYASVISLIPAPTPVTQRHVEIDKRYWAAICTKLYI